MKPTGPISHNKFYFRAALLYTVLLVAVSLYPLHIHPAQGSDKLVHFLMYFLLYSLWNLAGYGGWRLVFLLFLLGAGLEILQELLPVNRSGDIMDALANTAGLLAAYFAMKLGKP